MDVVETNAKDDRRPGETLRAAGVSRSFQGVQALTGVDLELHDHEVVGLIGPNGAGKSTLVNLLTGFDRADEGSVELSGRDVTRWGPDRRGRAGLTRTFQHSHAFRGLSVRENVEVAALGTGASPGMPRSGRTACCKGLVSPGMRMLRRPTSRTATSAVSAWPARSRRGPGSC